MIGKSQYISPYSFSAASAASAVQKKADSFSRFQKNIGNNVSALGTK